MNNQTIRLNKYLANYGIASRRDIKKLLKTMTITINGEQAQEPGQRITPYKDIIYVNGKKLLPPKIVYYLINKPKGVISTTADERGRKNVLSFVPTDERIYPVGRLDKDTTGLLILTNDGELTNRLTHPSFHVPKTYRAVVQGKVAPEQLRALRNGVLLDDGITSPATIKIIQINNQQTILEFVLHEGRNRQIRRMCETVGIKLLELDRIKFGPISKGNLKMGTYRQLTPKEISSLKTIPYTKYL